MGASSLFSFSVVVVRKKISVNLQPRVEAKLDKLSADKGLKAGEVIHEAITLLDYLTSEVSDGSRILCVDGNDQVKELVIYL